MHTDAQMSIDLPFGDFFSQICAKMDLDVATAQLGYKLSGSKARDLPFELSNEEQL